MGAGREMDMTPTRTRRSTAGGLPHLLNAGTGLTLPSLCSSQRAEGAGDASEQAGKTELEARGGFGIVRFHDVAVEVRAAAGFDYCRT